jgi:hypothetical protein
MSDNRFLPLRRALASPIRTLMITGCLFLMAACASGETWHRPDTDAATTRSDVSACRREAMRAEVATSGSLDESLGAGPQSLPSVTDRSGYPDGGGLSAEGAHAILRECLERRGYRPSRGP